MVIRKLILTNFLLISLSGISQREVCDCSNLSAEKIISKYYEFKKYGLEIKHSNSANADIMEVTINKILKTEGVRQSCIEACYDIWYVNGEEESYNNFVHKYGSIPKSLYLQNIDYIQTIVNIRELILRVYKFN